MKAKNISYLLILVTVLNTVILVSATEQSLNQNDITTTTPDQCQNAVVTLYIGTSPGTKYNVSTLQAPKSSCIRISLANSDVTDHTFRIDASTADNIAYFNIYTDPGKLTTSNFMTPNKDISIQFYCAEVGHKANGMFGTLIIGNPVSSSSASTSSSSNSKSISGTSSSTSNTTSLRTINSSPSFEVITLIASSCALLTYRKIKKSI